MRRRARRSQLAQPVGRRAFQADRRGPRSPRAAATPSIHQDPLARRLCSDLRGVQVHHGPPRRTRRADVVGEPPRSDAVRGRRVAQRRRREGRSTRARTPAGVACSRRRSSPATTPWSPTSSRRMPRDGSRQAPSPPASGPTRRSGAMVAEDPAGHREPTRAPRRGRLIGGRHVHPRAELADDCRRRDARGHVPTSPGARSAGGRRCGPARGRAATTSSPARPRTR